MIKKIQIKKVEVYGFKGFKDMYVFPFKETGKNIVIGDNSQGKTSVGESVIWAISGRNMDGNIKEINVLNNKSKVASVTVYFIDENGEDHILERKMNSTTTIKLDSVQMTQEKLKKHIDIDLFLMIFNPLYYISLDSNNARKAIYPLFPQITKNDILSKLKTEERQLLEHENFDETKTNDYLKEKRKELGDIIDKLKFLDGYMEKLKQPIVIPEAIIFDNNKIIDIEKQIKVLRDKKPEIKNLEELLIKKADIDKQIYEIKNEKFESEKIIAELKSKKALLLQELKTEENKEYTPANISEFESKYINLRSDYKITLSENNVLQEKKNKLNDRKIEFKEGDTCPTCKQLISKHSVDTLNTELQKEVMTEKSKIIEQQVIKKKTLEELEREGKELVDQITKAKELNEKSKIDFEKNNTEKITSIRLQVDNIDKELNNLNEVEELFKQEKSNKINQLLEKINELKIDELKSENEKIIKGFESEISNQISILEIPLLNLKKEKEIAAANETNRKDLLEMQENNKKDLIAKLKEISDLKFEEELINSKILAMKSFNTQKAASINEVISKHLKNVSLKFEKTIESTGEIKDTFEVLYDNKELKICSNSEVIKTGLEISKMISDLSGNEAPILIDNGESITKYTTSAVQVIETRVVENQKLSLLSDTGVAIEIKSSPVINIKNTKAKVSA